MSRFEDTLRRDLRQIADRATPSPDAWAQIQSRIADQEPIQETEIIMLTENTLTQRRWPLVAAAAAVVALAIAGVAVVNRGDDDQVPAIEPTPTVTPQPDSVPDIEPSVRTLPAVGEQIEPGRYSSDVIGTPLSLELSEGSTAPWTVVSNDANGIQIWSDDTGREFMAIGRIGSWMNAEEARDEQTRGAGSIAPDDIDGWIEANGIIVVDSADVEVGGRAATYRQIRLDTTPGATADWCPPGEQPCLWAAAGSADTATADATPVPFARDRLHSIWLVDMGDFEPVLVLAIPNLDDEETWFAEVVQPIVDSIEFGEPAPAVPGGTARVSTFDSGADGAVATLGVSLIVPSGQDRYLAAIAEAATTEAASLGAAPTVDDGATADGQIAAIDAAVARGDHGILIVPIDATVVPALETARGAGLLTVVLEPPADVGVAADFVFSTDDYIAGQLVGLWANDALGGAAATIAMLDAGGATTAPYDVYRDQGFLNGFGIVAPCAERGCGRDQVDLTGNGNEPSSGPYTGFGHSGDYTVACHEPTGGTLTGGIAAMEACLAANSDINLVYAVDEISAQGAYEALVAAGRADEVTIVSVGGTCDPGIRLVADGEIGATALRSPAMMASVGMRTIADYAATGEIPKLRQGIDYVDGWVYLVADSAEDPGANVMDSGEASTRCW